MQDDPRKHSFSTPIEACFLFHPENADGFEKPQHAVAVGLGLVLRRLEGDLHVGLGGEIVNLVGLGFLNDADQVGRIRHVTVMKVEAGIFDVRVLIDVLDAAGIERRRASLDAVDRISLVQQKLREISAILPGDTRNESCFS